MNRLRYRALHYISGEFLILIDIWEGRGQSLMLRKINNRKNTTTLSSNFVHHKADDTYTETRVWSLA